MSLKRKVDSLFLIGVLIFAGLFYTVLQSSKVTRESNRLVTQAHNILYNLEKVESAIAAIEGAHRGYIISGMEEFLEPVDKEKETITAGLIILDTLIGNNKEQWERLSVLSQFIAQKIEFSERGVILRQEGQMEMALRLVSSGKGKVMMDSIRMVSNSLEREEIHSLNEKTNYTEDLVVAQNRNYLLFSAFIFVVMCVFYVRVRKNTVKILAYRNKQDELIKELNYQNRQLDDFAHLTSHNIRSPAANIYTLISFLNENSSLDEYKEIYGRLAKVSRNLNETLNELIEVLQVKNNTSIQRDTLSFEGVFNKVKESMQGDILLSNAVITSNFTEVPDIKYPKTYLESIFHNLLSNAIKYRSSGRVPEVVVFTKMVNNQIVLEVADNGLGIDMQRFGDQVFGLRKTFHGNQNAKGIGLFMTKTQIETLGGEISVRSEIGKGTTFTIVFDSNSVVNASQLPTKPYAFSLNMF